MKTILSLILFLLCSATFAQYDGKMYDKGEAYYFRWQSPVIDSAETFTSPAIPAFAFMNLYNVGVVDTGEVDSDSKFVEYIKKHAIAIVQVKGGGTVDSLSSFVLEGRTPSNTWVTVDTIATAKEVSCMTKLSYNNLPYFSELRFSGTVADLTVSAYDVIVYIEVIIPKVFR